MPPPPPIAVVQYLLEEAPATVGFLTLLMLKLVAPTVLAHCSLRITPFSIRHTLHSSSLWCVFRSSLLVHNHFHWRIALVFLLVGWFLVGSLFGLLGS